MDKKKLIYYSISIILALVFLLFIIRYANRILRNESLTYKYNTDHEDDFVNIDNDDSLENKDKQDNDDLENKDKLDNDGFENKDKLDNGGLKNNDILDNDDSLMNIGNSDIGDDSKDIDKDRDNPVNDGNLHGNDNMKNSEIPQDLGEPQSDQTEGAHVDINDIEKPKYETDDITYGIDVAKWQGVIDWAKVKEARVEFAMIRVGYRTLLDGKITEDPYAKYNLQQAEKHGIKIGVYFFSSAINEREAKEEAKWVADYIASYKITYPVAFNCEGFTDRNNRQYGMTIEERTKLAIEFLDYISEKGYIPMFYAAKNELEYNRDWDAEILANRYKIWLAHYPNPIDSSNMKSSYSGTYDMWQYTSNGSVPGIKGAVDLNIAYFGFEKEAEAKDDIKEKEVVADPAALINFKEVNEKVTAKELTNLRDKPSLDNDSNVVYSLKYDETAIRTGIGDNGWSRVEYDGKILYAITSYLTTDLNYKENTKPTVDNPEAGITFTEVNEKVTAKILTNLRLVPSSESEDTIVFSLKNGQIGIRTGIGDNGWSRVEYEGQVLYALSSYLELVTEE
ncbi:MAG: glycoside hydrolase family 25 [Clostridiales bacterium]|nr:glycoside hydrolase family 25 [Clostridiales bacterium]